MPANIISTLESRSIPEPNTGCWLWLGAKVPSGYGSVWNGARPEQAHRVAYRAYIGEIPAGLEIDHRCGQRSCINPDHLRVVSHRENMRSSNAIMGINARKVICKRGHPLSGGNLHITVGGARQCRACGALHAKRKRANRHAQ